MASGRRRSIAIEIGEGRLVVPRSLAVMLVSAYGQDALSFTNDDGGLTPSAMIPDTLPQWPSIRVGMPSHRFGSVSRASSLKHIPALKSLTWMPPGPMSGLRSAAPFSGQFL
jgi:hypothetical protein